MFNKPVIYPRCLSIAGSDSGGGAGIQADLRTMSSLGVYGTTAITAITSQNTCCVTDIMNLPASLVRSQIDAVLSDIGTDAVKIGMIGTVEIAEVICQAITKYKLSNVVLDPVLVATNGDVLSNSEVLSYLKKYLFKKVMVVTPNVPEAEEITGIQIVDMESLYRAGKKMLQMGCKAAVVKGGHMAGDMATDVLFIKDQEPIEWSTPRYETPNTHGTGCTFSSAIASFLAKGYDLELSVKEAKTYLAEAIWAGARVQMGKGHGPVNHLYRPLTMVAEYRPTLDELLQMYKH